MNEMSSGEPIVSEPMLENDPNQSWRTLPTVLERYLALMAGLSRNEVVEMNRRATERRKALQEATESVM